jgi:hypothetical protein
MRSFRHRATTDSMETFKRWEQVQGIEWPCADVDISNATESLTMRLEFSKVVGGGDRDLLLRLPWGYVVGFASWQEFAHPWNNDVVIANLPKLPVGQWASYTFPILEVLDSNLVAGFGDGQRAAYAGVRHFRIVTLDHTVDILATAEPSAEWVS